ncbi:hypothetical protein QOZ80_1AG0029380 [Eleusine coracana subsp. coracana]|nr:hypothetical protein QOZ80_1AG0029380 [Eleusine coracana subsp. coracana]
MDEVPGRSRSVRATRSIFGESIGGRRPPEKNRAGNVVAKELNLHCSIEFRIEELVIVNLSPEMKHLAKSEMDKLRERKAAVDKERAGAESELSRARATARELERQIEQAKARAASQRSELDAMPRPHEEDRAADDDAGAEQAVHEELDRARQELRRLRAAARSAAEAKAKAESDIVAAALKIQTDLRAADEMKRLVEEANEEHVLVELARIEAERELREVEAQRRAESERHAKEMEETRAKIEALRREAGRVREMEAKLAVTSSDVAVLQAQMELVRAMASKSGVVEKEEEDRAAVRAAEAELGAAREELERVRAEGFAFMTAMDSTRTEIVRVTEEVGRLKARERESDARVQELNAKLLKARARRDTAAGASERSDAIVSNLTSALQQLRAETKAADRETELAEMERRCVRAEAETADAEAAVNEARIGASVRELEAAKAAEAAAMRRLKTAVEGATQARSAQGKGKASITISRFEYEYLTGRAALVRVVAEKKVAAAQAWVRALQAGERELAARAEALEREVAELREKEARAAEQAERAAEERRAMEQELYDLNLAAERDGLLCAYPPRQQQQRRQSGARVSATARRARARRASVSSANGGSARAPSFAIKRKRKVVPGLMKLIRERRDNKAAN